MTISKILITGAFIALSPIAATHVAAQEEREEQREEQRSSSRNNGMGFIAGAIIGGVIAGAIASDDDDDDYRYDNGYYHNHRPSYGCTYRPRGTRHTICYRQRRVCYTRGHYSDKWTRRVFGYYGRSRSGRR